MTKRAVCHSRTYEVVCNKKPDVSGLSVLTCVSSWIYCTTLSSPPISAYCGRGKELICLSRPVW